MTSLVAIILCIFVRLATAVGYGVLWLVDRETARAFIVPFAVVAPLVFILDARHFAMWSRSRYWRHPRG